MISNSLSERELQLRKRKLDMIQTIVRFLKKGIEVESQGLEQRFPKCKVCDDRFEENKGSRESGDFICSQCQHDIYSESPDMPDMDD